MNLKQNNTVESLSGRHISTSFLDPVWDDGRLAFKALQGHRDLPEARMAASRLLCVGQAAIQEFYLVSVRLLQFRLQAVGGLLQ